MRPKIACAGSGGVPQLVRLRSIYGGLETLYECRVCRQYVSVYRRASRAGTTKEHAASSKERAEQAE